MFVTDIATILPLRATPSATRLRDRGRWQRALQRVIGHLPGQRERRASDRLAEAADRITMRPGRRRHLQDSPHLGRSVDLYV